ncbi:MAG: RDD family protein [Methanothrix sp.]|uniref:RDD family protein n=1 Tax=Methanothrix sp. TaxID=90426 RepID=UPI003BB1AD1B
MEELVLARWVDRFWAWLIDVLLMGLVWHRLSILLKVEAVHLEGVLMLSCLLFLYWTVLEGYRGQSLGKMLLNIVVAGPYGEAIGYRDSAVQSFGKAFLLPADLLIGLFAFRGGRQRLFNRLSDTVVREQIL